MDISQHRRHNKNLLMIHLIFVTKYRKKLLLGDFRDSVKQYLFDTCVTNHWYIKRMETDQDHVHILLQYNPTDSITQLVVPGTRKHWLFTCIYPCKSAYSMKSYAFLS